MGNNSQKYYLQITCHKFRVSKNFVYFFYCVIYIIYYCDGKAEFLDSISNNVHI